MLREQKILFRYEGISSLIVRLVCVFLRGILSNHFDLRKVPNSIPDTRFRSYSSINSIGFIRRQT